MKMIHLALATAISLGVGACASAPSSRESAVPPTYTQNMHRDSGVLNTPNNSGNPPQDIDPHTVQWGDVRPPYTR